MGSGSGPIVRKRTHQSCLLKRGWIVLHGPMAAASSVFTYAVVMRLI